MHLRTLAQSGTGKSARGRRLRIAATCAAGVLLASTAPSAAHAASHIDVELPINGAAAVIATDTRVFISGGEFSTDVVVTDVNGAVTATLPRLAGATGLALSPDQRTLYIALTNGGAIAAIDTETLKETARFRVSGCPRSLAVAGRYLFFGYGCERRWGGNIGRVDLEQPPTFKKKLTPEMYGSPALAVGGDPTILVAGQMGLMPSTVYVYRVGADGSLTEVRRGQAAGDYLRDVTVTPDSGAVLTACGYPYSVREYPIDQIQTPVRRYETGPYPSAVRVTRDGAYVAGGAYGIGALDVFMFDRKGKVLASFETGDEIVDGGLAWSPDGTRLYAISHDDYPTPPPAPHLHVFTRPTAP